MHFRSDGAEPTKCADVLQLCEASLVVCNSRLVRLRGAIGDIDTVEDDRLIHPGRYQGIDVISQLPLVLPRNATDSVDGT